MIDGRGYSCGTLISGLPDEVVKDKLWLILCRSPSVNLLLGLRSLSISWRNFVGDTLEWKVLNFLQLDAHGYNSFVLHHRTVWLTPNQRLLYELAHFRIVVSENMERIEDRIRYTRTRAKSVPVYVKLQDCPPYWSDCPDYYEL